MNSRNRLMFLEVTKGARVKAHEVMLRRGTTHVPARKTREMARRIQGTIRKMPHCPVSKTAQQVPTSALNFHQKPRATPKGPSIPPTSQHLINSI